MYSDGIFKSRHVEVHPQGNIPRDVMVLYSLDDLQDFFESKKDLGLCTVRYSQDFQKLIDQLLTENREELNITVPSLSLLKLNLDSLSGKLLNPFWSIIKAISENLDGNIRLTIKAIHDQMCPFFHVDNLALRLIVTLQGPGTQWLQGKDVNRKNLGKGARKLIAKPNSYLQQIKTGQVALVKGLRFPGSKGLVHRSPAINPLTDPPRIILRLDFYG